MVRSLASAFLGGRRTRSGRRPQKASESETRSRATPALYKSEPISYALAFCFLLDAAHYPRYTHLHANITLLLRLHPVGCLHALPLLCWPYL